MAKVKGPLLSLAASGTYDSVLTFRTKGSSSHAFKQNLSTKPRSSNQTSHTSTVQDMLTSWRSQSGATKTAWAACGATFNMNGFNLWWKEWFLQGSTIVTPPTRPCP